MAKASKVIVPVVKATAEYAVIMEILWPVVFPGNTFHECLIDGARTARARVLHRIGVWRTLNIIRALPETQRKEHK